MFSFCKPVLFLSLLFLFHAASADTTETPNVNKKRKVKTELQLDLCSSVTSDQIELSALQMSKSKLASRFVYYFSDPENKLMTKGIQLRLRQSQKKNDATAKKSEVTVKIRNAKIDLMPEHLFKRDKFKCEYDKFNDATPILSCSLTEKIDTATADHIVAGTISFFSQLSQDQLDLARVALAEGEFNLIAEASAGPKITQEVLSLSQESDNGSTKITLEKSVSEDRESPAAHPLQISAKVPSKKVNKTAIALKQLARKMGFEYCPPQD